MKRRARRRLQALLLSMLVMLAMPTHATMVPSYPFDLSKADRRVLEQLACIGPHGVPAEKIEARTLARGDLNRAYAGIECKTHGSFRHKPMSYATSCEVMDGKWTCGKGNLRIVVPVDGREIIVSPGMYEPGFAYDTISRVARAGTFQGYSLARVVRSACGLAPGSVSEWIDIHCDDNVVVTISSWCPQSECPRIVSINQELL